MDLTGLVDEEFFLPRLMRLTDCLREELVKNGSPATCYHGLMVGGIRPLGLTDCTDGDCGVSWVGGLESFPSAIFPQPDVPGVTTCGKPWAMRVELGVARCYPRPVGKAANPGAQPMFDANRLFMADMAAMKRALTCCWKGSAKERADWKFAVEGWTALEPANGKSGGVLTGWIG